MSTGLTEQQKTFYMENGYLPIERLFNPDLLTPLIAELNQVVAGWALIYEAEGRLSDRYDNEPFERRLFKMQEAMNGACPEVRQAISGKRKTPGMFHVMTLSPILDVVESLIGPEIMSHPQFNSRAKLPDKSSVVNWHQDIGFLDPDAEETFMVNFWLPLVDTDAENGCLEVIPGSHKIGRLPFKDNPEYILPDAMPTGQSVICPVPKGGVLLLQHRTVHRSGPNYSDGIRWSLDIRYSDSRKPTGRAGVPGFIARSKEAPEKVTKNHQEWMNLFEDVKS